MLYYMALYLKQISLQKTWKTESSVTTELLPVTNRRDGIAGIVAVDSPRRTYLIMKKLCHAQMTHDTELKLLQLDANNS